MVAHVAFNSHGVVADFLLDDVAGQGIDLEQAPFHWLPAWYVASAVVIAGLALWAVSRTLPNAAGESLPVEAGP